MEQTPRCSLDNVSPFRTERWTIPVTRKERSALELVREILRETDCGIQIEPLPPDGEDA